MTVALTFVTADNLRWGPGTGSGPAGVAMPAQVDINFWNIKQAIEALQSAGDPVGIDHFAISGSQLTVYMTDSTTRGPYTLPVSAWRFRDAWAPTTVYLALDIFTINGALYMVIFDHTSAATFDAGANDGMGHSYYALLLSNPGNSLPTGGGPRQSLQKSTGADYAVTWGWTQASDVVFTASTGSGLVSDTVADALDELAHLAGHPDAVNVTFEPVSGSPLTSDTVADALEELATRDASQIGFTPSSSSGLVSGTVGDALDELATLAGHPDAANVAFEPSSGSGLTSDTVADALDELAGLVGGGGGGGATALSGLTDVSVSEGSGIDGYVLSWNDGAGKWTAVSLGIGSAIQAFDADLSALAADSTNGLLVHTGAGTAAARTLTAGNGIGITDGDGVSGNPTVALSANAQIDSVEFVIDGAGSTLTTGIKGYVEVPFACTITEVTLLADQSGSVVVDVFKCTYAQFDASSTHPVSGDKITASAPPAISSAAKSQDATLTGWATSISAGDILAFNINSATTIQRVTISLKVTHV